MNKKNLANAELAADITDSATTIAVKLGQAASLPTAPFYATISPIGMLSTDDNSEIIQVTSAAGDSLTVVRGQRGTIAKSFSEGSILVNAIYVEDLSAPPVAVTVTTGATTAAKVGSSPAGNYSPLAGDIIEVTFVNGSNVANPTLNIDGSGAKNIRLGQSNASTLTMGLGTAASSNVKIRMWYDGTYWQLYGANDNTNTTYSAISTAEIDDGTSSTARTITGQRAQAIVDKARLAALMIVYDVGKTFWSETDDRNPNIILGFGTWAALEGVALGGVAGSGPFNVAAGTIIGADTHTLTTAQMPSHTHTQNQHRHSVDPPSTSTNSTGAHTHNTYVGYLVGGGSGARVTGSSGDSRGNATTSAGAHSHTVNIAAFNSAYTTPTNQNTGGDGAHNNIQRTLVGYLWKRTA